MHTFEIENTSLCSAPPLPAPSVCHCAICLGDDYTDVCISSYHFYQLGKNVKLKVFYIVCFSLALENRNKYSSTKTKLVSWEVVRSCCSALVLYNFPRGWEMLMAIEPSEEDTRKKLMWEIAGHGVEEGWSGCTGDSWGLGAVVLSTRGSTCNFGDNICHVLGVCWRLTGDYSWRPGFERALRGATWAVTSPVHADST